LATQLVSTSGCAVAALARPAHKRAANKKRFKYIIKALLQVASASFQLTFKLVNKSSTWIIKISKISYLKTEIKKYILIYL
jgi:hypothetical protein